MKRVHVRLKGCLQGVGFRPFVYNTAKRLGLFGYVRNDSSGVELDLEGSKEALEHFLVLLEEEKPRLAHIASRELQFLKPLGYADFQILPSTNHGSKEASILPDIATCDECLKELADPNDIRFAHPFITCCSCGPRFTIVTGLPYDRPNTTMNAFEMCPACKAEYKNPLDRRFHAQPIACPSCGPTLSLFSKKGELLGQGKKAIDKTLEAIKAGSTLALKGIGGYHLLADARNESAVRTLRERKGRINKPFAVMFPDLASIRRYTLPSRLEEALILAPERPIVLVKSKSAILPDTIAPGLDRIGVFLPYSPLHHLIFKALKVPLVATSGNFSEEPIVKDDYEALEMLTRYADLILMHDRPIARRCDDSVLKVTGGMPALVRRSRGYAPLPVRLPFSLKRKVLAAGGFLKNTVALGFEDQVILSQHTGDLSSFEAMEAYQGATKDLCALYDFKPALIVHDLHPAYPSSRWAKVQTKAPSVAIQHHFAHVLACMAENGLENEALGVAWDGAGFGTDGTVWGGEFLACTYTGFKRLAHFRPLKLIGSELAQKEPRRMALSVLFELFGKEALQLKLPPTESFSKQELRVLFKAWKLGINAPLTSSAGRLFDAFASLLGVCQVSSYEAEAAMRFEALGTAGTIDTLPMFAEALREILRGVPTERIVSRFLATLADVCFRVSLDAGIPQVCLTGGVFLNDPLTTRVQEKLKDGFRVFRHNHTPPGDGGISLGQAIYGGMIDLEQPPQAFLGKILVVRSNNQQKSRAFMYQFSSAQIPKAARIIAQAKRLVAFTGSGMSKESGIPTFRDPGGLWDRFDPEELSFQALTKSLAQGRLPKGAFAAFFLEFIETLKRAAPNPGHAALKAFEDLGFLKAVITQNIDNLHAEVGNKHVVELHGNIYRFVCLNCRKKHFFGKEGFICLAHAFIEALQSADAQRVLSAIPRCACGGAMRPDIVGFGEPIQGFDGALSLTMQSDVLLIVGTSGEVMPAASLPEYAKRSGATLIEVNLAHGAFPEYTDLYIQGSAATVLPEIALEIER